MEIKAILRAAVLALAGASTASVAAAGEVTPRYAVTAVVPLGAPDRWDYLSFDARTKRVYVSHGDEVTVVDGRSGKLVGDVTGLPGSHGSIVADDLNRGFADSAKDRTVLIFDPADLHVLGTAPSGDDADGMAYDAASHRVFVANGDASAVTVLDGATGRFVATLSLGGKPEFLAADGRGRLYVNLESTRQIAVVDARSATVLSRFAIPDCERPHGIAIDAAANRIFTSCVNGKLVVVDAISGRTVAELPIGKGTDAASFDAKSKLAFSSNGDGTLSVIAEKDADTFVVLGEVPTIRGARTMTLDPDTGRVYLVSADIDHVDPPTMPGGHPHTVYRPGSVKLYFFDPVR